MKKSVQTSQNSALPTYLASVDEHENYFIVHLKGSMDRQSLEANRSKMSDAIRKLDLYSKNLLCDFGEVTKVDTTTVAALVSRFSDFKSGKHKMIFFNLSDELKSYMDIVKVLPYFSIRENLEDALKVLQT